MFLSHPSNLYSELTSYKVYPRRGDGDAPTIISFHSQPLGGASHYVRVSFLESSWRDAHKFLRCTMEYVSKGDDAEALCPTLWLEADFFQIRHYFCIFCEDS